jgi:hypothetical protein
MIRIYSKNVIIAKRCALNITNCAYPILGEARVNEKNIGQNIGNVSYGTAFLVRSGMKD